MWTKLSNWVLKPIRIGCGLTLDHTPDKPITTLDETTNASKSDMGYDSDRLTDNVDIVYNLREGGWSDLYIIVDHITYEISITHIFDCPMILLINMCLDLLNGVDNLTVVLPNEPGNTSIRINRNPVMRHIISVKINDGWYGANELDKNKLIFSFNIKIQHFVGLFYHQFGKIHTLSRERSYKKNRPALPSHEFNNLKTVWESWLTGSIRKMKSDT